MKKILRNIPTSIMLIIGMSMLFFLCFNGLSIINEIKNTIYKIPNSKYEYRKNIFIGLKDVEYFTRKYTENLYIDTFRTIKNENIDCLLKTTMYVGEAVSQETVNIIISNNVQDVANEICGIRIDNNFVQKKEVIIGEGMKSNCIRMKDELFLKMYNEYYKVRKIINGSNNFDIYISFNSLSEDILTNIYYFNEMGCSFEIMSKTDNIMKKYNRFREKLLIQNNNYDVELQKTSKNLTSFEEICISLNKLVIIVMLVFASVNCIVISRLWIEKRKKEYTICKIFGATNKDIMIRLLKSISKLCAISFVVGLIMEEIHFCITGSNYINSKYMILEFLIMLGVFIVVIGINVLMPLIFTKKINVINEMRHFGV